MDFCYTTSHIKIVKFLYYYLQNYEKFASNNCFCPLLLLSALTILIFFILPSSCALYF